VFFGMIVGRHLSNILIFRRFARRPEEVSGQVVMAHSLVLSISTFHYLVVAVPVAMIAVFCPTPFTIGGAVAAVSVFYVHYVWILRHKRASNLRGGSNAGQSVQSDTNQTQAPDRSGGSA
jgi:hypothetical protein